MIKEEDVKKLSELSRIDLNPEEVSSYQKQMDEILEYISQITEVASKDLKEVGLNYNVLREDSSPHESGLYSDDIKGEFPQEEDGYLKVKKIL